MYISLAFLLVGSALQTGEPVASSFFLLSNRSTATQNIGMYQASRVITGMGSGVLFSTVPVYQYVISVQFLPLPFLSRSGPSNPPSL